MLFAKITASKGQLPFARAISAVLGAALLLASPLSAQDIQTVDPSALGDIAGKAGAAQASADDVVTDATDQATESVEDAFANEQGVGSVAPNWSEPSALPLPNQPQGNMPQADGANGAIAVAPAGTKTYKEDDLIGAAEGLFGKGAEGIARAIQDLLKKQGEPTAYITGREASGAFVVGARYGSGTLHHKIEGERPVYWTGPSIGFDTGANMGKTFVLVYNLHDTEQLFKRFPAGEGQAYMVGGLTISYMRWGDVVLIPIRMGAGLRLGVNAGYMKFSKKQRWLPF